MSSNSVLKLFIMLHILSHVLFVMIPILPLNRQSLSTPEGWHSVFLHGLLKRCPGCPLQSQEPIRTVIISPHYVLLHAHEISSTFLRWATIMYYATKQGSQCGWFLWIINFSFASNFSRWKIPIYIIMYAPLEHNLWKISDLLKYDD